jgi:membrane protease YdiL (CAAX protease family)
LSDEPKGFFAVGGGFRDESPRTYEFRQPGTSRVFVLDDEDALGLRHGHKLLLYHPDVLPEPTESAPIVLSAEASDRKLTRGRAAAEVLICSGYPTQLLIIAALAAFGIQPMANGAISPLFVFAVSAVDTVLLLGLVFLFLHHSGDRPRDVFFQHGNVFNEIGLGALLLPAVFALVVAAQYVIQRLAPYLRNVEVSPFSSLLASPLLVAGFVALVMIAGGVREELQRGFLLYRFEQRLGGGSLGIALTSIAFGLGHTLQGWDAAIITALMGAFWGAIYLTRRSVVSTVTNHALFNLTQVVLGYATLTS